MARSTKDIKINDVTIDPDVPDDSVLVHLPNGHAIEVFPDGHVTLWGRGDSPDLLSDFNAMTGEGTYYRSAIEQMPAKDGVLTFTGAIEYTGKELPFLWGINFQGGIHVGSADATPGEACKAMGTEMLSEWAARNA